MTTPTQDKTDLKDVIAFAKKTFPKPGKDQKLLVDVLHRKTDFTKYTKSEQKAFNRMRIQGDVTIENEKVHLTTMGRTIARGLILIYGDEMMNV